MRTPTSKFSLRAGWLISSALALSACYDRDEDKATPPLPAALGDTFALTSNNRLLSFDLATRNPGRAVSISNLQDGEALIGIDVRPGGSSTQQLYALGDSGRLYLVDPATGAATFVAALQADPADISDGNAPYAGLSGTRFGLDFNPIVDRLRVVSDTGQNLRVNVDNGNTFTDGALTVSGAAVTGIAETAYGNDFAAACRTQHYFVDPEADRLLVAANSNAGTLAAVGALGVDATGAAGLDVLTGSDGSNTLLAALMVGGSTRLYTVDTSSGAATDRGSIAGLSAGEALLGLAVRAQTATPAQAPGELLALTEDDQLVSFTGGAPQKLCTSGVAVAVPAGETLRGFDLRPETGELIALTTGVASRLYALDPATGAMALKSTLSTAASGTSFGIDFNPTVDRLRIVSDAGQNLRVNVDTGAVTVDGALNGASTNANAAAYTNSLGGLTAVPPAASAFATSLYVIDAAADQLLLQSPPNNGTLNVVGALGLDVETIAAIDINGRTGQALAALTAKGASVADLYTVNLGTGAATRVNAIGGGKRIKALAFTENRRATLIGLTTDNRLTSIDGLAPGAASAPVAISGLTGGETLLGLDVRPATGDLVAASDQNRLYALSFDGSTASATLLSTLSVSLAGSTFGVDFNPVADRLRIVSDASQNLRINVATGAVTVDGVLTPAASIFGAAYTKSFGGTTSTALFYLDAGADRLLGTSDPNGGTLADVGALGIDVGIEGDFDVAGGQDGVVLAALQRTGEIASRLYRIDLLTGAATELGSGIGDGSFVVRGLAVQLQ